MEIKEKFDFWYMCLPVVYMVKYGGLYTGNCEPTWWESWCPKPTIKSSKIENLFKRQAPGKVYPFRQQLFSILDAIRPILAVTSQDISYDAPELTERELLKIPSWFDEHYNRDVLRNYHIGVCNKFSKDLITMKASWPALFATINMHRFIRPDTDRLSYVVNYIKRYCKEESNSQNP